MTYTIHNTLTVIFLGLTNFEILPVEPLQVNNVKIGGAESSVSLKQNYWNVNVYGITKGLQIEAKSYVAFDTFSEIKSI